MKMLMMLHGERHGSVKARSAFHSECHILTKCIYVYIYILTSCLIEHSGGNQIGTLLGCYRLSIINIIQKTNIGRPRKDRFASDTDCPTK